MGAVRLYVELRLSACIYHKHAAGCASIDWETADSHARPSQSRIDEIGATIDVPEQKGRDRYAYHSLGKDAIHVYET